MRTNAISVVHAKKTGSAPDVSDADVRARRIVEDMAILLEAGLVARASPPELADAFIGSRLESRGRIYGTLTRGTHLAAIIARASPTRC